MKHLPFQSSYRPDFEVVEERQGHTRLFPHTAQLPALQRALNLEFRTGLPGPISRVDRTSKGFGKILLQSAATLFCLATNASRRDALQLFPVPDLDLVTRIAIVQHLTTDTPFGTAHRFRFFGGADFFPEIYLSGKRIAFAAHVLERFNERVPNHLGEDLSRLITAFYGGHSIALPVGSGRACLLPYRKSFLAFTYKESAEEMFFTTCLTVNEINHLDLELPPQAFNLHYQLPFTPPRLRHWMPVKAMLTAHRYWENKVLIPPEPPPKHLRRWHDTAAWIKDVTVKNGHGPGSRFLFVDHLPGPLTLSIKPTETEPQWDDLQACKTAYPDEDWDAIVADLEKQRHVLKRIVS